MPPPAWKHMAPNDVPLFASFILSPDGQAFDSWEFDVVVGPFRALPEGTDPMVIRLNAWLNRVRIDAVGWRANMPTIFEVKPRARLSALGQLISYRHFFMDDFGVGADLAVITDSVPHYMGPLWEREHVRVYLVAPAARNRIPQALAWTNARMHASLS